MTADLHREAREVLARITQGPWVAQDDAPRLVRELLAENERLTGDLEGAAYRAGQQQGKVAEAVNTLIDAQAWAAWFAAERDDWARVADVTLTHTLRDWRDCRDDLVIVEAAIDRVRDAVIWADPGRCGGIPCVRGTRVHVECVTELLDTYIDDQIVDFYPTLTVTQVAVIRALESAANELRRALDGEAQPQCGCAACSTLPIMHVCSVCGSKRCPHAADHNRPCNREA